MTQDGGGGEVEDQVRLTTGACPSWERWVVSVHQLQRGQWRHGGAPDKMLHYHMCPLEGLQLGPAAEGVGYLN